MEPGFEPPSDAHRTELVVGDADIDELLHVNNVRWVRWVIDVAVAHSAAMGLTFQDYIALGVIWVVRRHEIDYLCPARKGEALTAYTWVDSYGTTSSLRKAVFCRASDGRPLVTAATTWVMVDLGGRVTTIPDAVSAKLPARLRASANRPSS